MSQSGFGKDAFVAMFHTIGLDGAKMDRWHHEFETRWPDAHQSFLEWLGLSAPEIKRVRAAAKGTAKTP